MPTDLGREFPPTWAGPIPHISAEDAAIWDRARQRLLTGALRFWADVAVGPLPRVPEGTAPELVRMWQRITRPRIDVLIDYDDRLEIVELRHAAQLNALGRLAGYRVLLGQDPPAQKPIVAHLVTDLLSDAVRIAAEDLGIKTSTA